MGKSFGLALGGGAALGIAHLGVIKYIQEKEIKITHTTGTSAGSIAAAALALGISLDEMINYARSLSWRKFTALRFQRNGLLSTEIMMKRLEELLGDKTFDDIQIPLAVVATDLLNGQKVVLKDGSILSAVVASCAIPGIFAPIKRGEKLLCDGGLTENVPVMTLEHLGAKDIIAVDLSSKLITGRDPSNLFETIIRAINILLLQTHQFKGSNHIVITPELGDFTPLDIHRVDELIKVGYDAAEITIGNYLGDNVNTI